MLRILFVDDAPNVLSGLRRMTHKKREEWQTSFVGSGEAAMELLQNSRFDVVVADMRMPEMDGSELLKLVAQKHPDTLRFILSGHSDKDLILKAIPWTHQFITKPCDLAALHQRIQSSMALKGLLADSALHERLSAVKALPSLPSTYVKLCAELQSETGTIKSAAKIIASDIGLTAKILQLVNSAFFALPRHIESLEQAVSLLGLETIRALTLMTGVFSEESTARSGSLSVSELFDHCATVSSVAKSVAQFLELEQKQIEDSFFAGALHDIGKLIILRDFRSELSQIEQLVSQDGLSPIEAELVCLGVSHALIGAHLLAIWGIPHPIIEAVAYHHTAGKSGSTELTPTTAVYLSDRIVHAHCAGEGFAEFVDTLDLEYITNVGLLDSLEKLYDIGACPAKHEGIDV